MYTAGNIYNKAQIKSHYYDICRLARNECEKLRRDRLNASIGELAELMPDVLNANRKVDKSTVLRLATNFLRFYNGMLIPNIVLIQFYMQHA